MGSVAAVDCRKLEAPVGNAGGSTATNTLPRTTATRIRGRQTETGDEALLLLRDY